MMEQMKNDGELVKNVMKNPNHKHSELTDEIIEAFFAVYSTLGYGFLEQVYEKAMFHELQTMALNVKSQHPIKVMYNDQLVGTYYADLLVEDLVIVELKAASELSEAHECQLTNYLKATNIEVGLLLNFGPKPKIKRKVHTNSYHKGHKVHTGPRYNP